MSVPRIGACRCGHIGVVGRECQACGIRGAHIDGCRFRLAATCGIGIACPHGYDVCPMCDPCTCQEIRDTVWRRHAMLMYFRGQAA